MTVVVRVLELPEVLTRLFTVVDGVRVAVEEEVDLVALLVEPLRDAVDDVVVEAVLDVEEDVPEEVEAEADVEVEPLREAEVEVPEEAVLVEPLREAEVDDDVDVPEEVEVDPLREAAAPVESELRVEEALVAVRVVAVAEDERVAAVDDVLVTVDSAWSERTSLALADDLVTVAEEEALASVAVRTVRFALRELKERSGYCIS